MIGIIDYGSGNVQAIATIYKNLNIDYLIISDPGDLKKANKLVLPGVGAFDATMQQLIDSGLRDELNKQYEDEQATGKISEKQKDNFISMEALETMIAKILRDVKPIIKKYKDDMRI